MLIDSNEIVISTVASSSVALLFNVSEGSTIFSHNPTYTNNTRNTLVNSRTHCRYLHRQQRSYRITMGELNKVVGIPERVFYIPNCISEEEESRIMHNVYSAPKPKWTCLSNRKVQNWGGVPHPKGMIPEEIPCWLQQYIDLCSATSAYPKDKLPNHVLVNEYLPGQGIMPHLDGPLFYPTTCTISCGSHTILNFHPKQDKESDCSQSNSIIYQLLLERRSLVIIQEDMYNLYPHSIGEQHSDTITNAIANLSMCATKYCEGDNLARGTRISLTIRHVPQTCKFNLKFSK